MGYCSFSMAYVPLLILSKLTTVDRTEIIFDTATIEQRLQTGGNNVILNGYILSLMLGTEAAFT